MAHNLDGSATSTLVVVVIINDREIERSRGFGFCFVTFSNEKAMRDAIEGMNDQNLDGRNTETYIIL
ncbi:PREDICTED: glycine-rich [Prunus dulcis]|uniref:PREDICTED: glycine-rich n=1 Tax=Prunus dulcis TaxID=3755 RepID=A0A5E4FDJ7_PRUDU|nr:hypothetical protein L3X38_040759 [Prunus dulcis]VVA24691.1 PREDICTED: glycine-rich [Prunus dulcis]